MIVTLCVAVLAGDSLAVDALAPYRGRPVLSIEIDTPVDDDVVELKRLIAIQPGFLLATDDVDAALKRLYALGRFSDVGVTAERRQGTVSLHFYVRPMRRLRELT